VTTAATPLLLRRLTRGQLLVFDGMLAAAVALLGWYAAAETPLPSHRGWHEPVWVTTVTGLLLAAPVAVRRRWPTAAAWAALAIAALSVACGVIPDYAGLAPTAALCLVLYTVGADVPRGRSVRLVLVGVVGIAAVFILAAGQPFEVALVAWVLGACWTVGRTIRERRAIARRSAEQATELAVGQERLRIARELHDVVAHSMSMIAVKATIADHVADAHPQEMREALRVIATTSRDALGELRRALGVLRTEGTLLPTPGLAGLAGLAAAARSAGVVVDLEMRGAGALPEGVALAVFRLVQEALTNGVKHAHATKCRVAVDIGAGEGFVKVADNGTAAAAVAAKRDDSAQPGQGLIGMRERVAVFGGELVAGPADAGGWVVATTLRWAP
jgi:signal transduction histidine kinase